MSCEKNGAKAAAAGAAAGLPRLGSKLSNITGAMLSRVQQAGESGLAARLDTAIDAGGRLMAPTAALAAGAFKLAEAPETKKIAGVAGGVAAGYMLIKDKPAGIRRATGQVVLGGLRTAAALVPQVQTAMKVIKKVECASSLVGDLAGYVSRQEDVSQVMQEKRTLLFFKSKTPVTLWKSSLTGLINRQDVIGTSRFSGKNIASSEGVMFRTGGKTWHRGTTVVKMPGGQRTITHLQGLSLPSSHYYFDRPVSDEQAVGVASGKIGPGSVPGYVGQVSSTEGLCTGWAQAKHSLLKARLYWPPGGNNA